MYVDEVIVNKLSLLVRARLDSVRRNPNPVVFQADDGIRDLTVTGVQPCALPISDIIRDCLQRIARLDHVPEITIHPSPKQWRYRVRATWQIDQGTREIG